MTSNSTDKVYSLKTNTTQLSAGIKLFLSGACVFLFLALSYHSLVWWALFTVNVCSVFLVVFVIKKSPRLKMELILHEQNIELPQTLISQKHKYIDYKEISTVDITTVWKQEMITIVHKDGKLSYPKKMFADEEAFNELLSELKKRISHTES